MAEGGLGVDLTSACTAELGSAVPVVPAPVPPGSPGVGVVASPFSACSGTSKDTALMPSASWFAASRLETWWPSGDLGGWWDNKRVTSVAVAARVRILAPAFGRLCQYSHSEVT